MGGSGEPVSGLGDAVQPPPDEAVEAHDEQRHDGDAQEGAREVTDRGGLRDIGPEALGGQGVGAPGHDLGQDARVPGTSRGGHRAGHPYREDRGQDERPPAQASRETEGGCRLPQVIGDGHRTRDGVEQDVPHGTQGHERDRPEADGEPGRDHEHGEEREQEVGREARGHLDDRLGDAGHPGVHADPDPDGRPDERRQHHHGHHPSEGEHAIDERVGHVGAGQLGTDVAREGQATERDHHHHADVERPVAGEEPGEAPSLPDTRRLRDRITIERRRRSDQQAQCRMERPSQAPEETIATRAWRLRPDATGAAGPGRQTRRPHPGCPRA